MLVINESRPTKSEGLGLQEGSIGPLKQLKKVRK